MTVPDGIENKIQQDTLQISRIIIYNNILGNLVDDDYALQYNLIMQDIQCFIDISSQIKRLNDNVNIGLNIYHFI
ncbi:hypothetical protein D3C71_1484900 [compost metagenome]